MAVENRGGSSIGITVHRCTGAEGGKIFGEVLEHEGEDVGHWQGCSHGGRFVGHRELADRRRLAFVLISPNGEGTRRRRIIQVSRAFGGEIFLMGLTGCGRITGRFLPCVPSCDLFPPRWLARFCGFIL